MSSPLSFAGLRLFIVLACIVGASDAQLYSAKPARIVIAEVGSGNDLVARATVPPKT